MLVRTIETLLKCDSIERIIVTTDSLDYAELAKANGAEVPFIRSAELSGDKINTIDVIKDVITKLKLSRQDNVTCVYATNPLLDARIIDLGLILLEKSKFGTYVTPLVKYGFPPQRSISLIDTRSATMTNREFMYMHSQNLPDLFHETAQFWWATATTWDAGIGMQENIVPIIIKDWMQQDIDTLDDWIVAEAKYDFKVGNNKKWDEELSNLEIKYLAL